MSTQFYEKQKAMEKQCQGRKNTEKKATVDNVQADMFGYLKKQKEKIKEDGLKEYGR